ncbi:MAG: hypothetical protein KDB02_02710 [Acidimicrobiales bacterium]|nr:hypothetical protein [Acidimicrobiales bacterium]
MQIHRNLPTRRLAAAALTIALGVCGIASCSSDGSDASDTTTTTKVTATTASPQSTTEAPSSTTHAEKPSKNDKSAYVEAIKGTLGSGFPETTANCISKGVVDEIGVDRWTHAGITADLIGAQGPFKGLGLDKATAEKLYDVMDDCTGSVREALVASVVAGAPPEARKCVDGVLTEKVVHDAAIESFQGQDSTNALDDKLEECRTKG